MTDKMTDVEEVLAIERIKRTKARYWYYMDMKDWDGLATVFTTDAIVDFRGERDLKPGQPISLLPPVEEALAAGDVATYQGRDFIAKWYGELLQEWRTVHHGHASIIEVTGKDSATGIWPLFDYISDGIRTMKGYGHYYENYRFEDGEWRIAYLALTRLWKDGVHPAAFVGDPLPSEDIADVG